MLLGNEKTNAQLLFTISFCATALAIYVLKIDSFGPAFDVSHTFIQNVFFINITFLGSGIFCISLIIYLFYKKKNSLAGQIIISTFISVVIIQTIKIYLHNDGLQFFFEDRQYLFNSVSQKGLFFMSGHTAIAFCLATILAMHFNNMKKTAYLFFSAFIVAYSRIYLSHHTIADLLAGAFAGIFSTTFGIYFSLNFSKFKKRLIIKTHRVNKSSRLVNPSFE